MDHLQEMSYSEIQSHIREIQNSLEVPGISSDQREAFREELEECEQRLKDMEMDTDLFNE